MLLWPDTFDEYFLPHTARAAVEVLESFGYRVTIPERVVCCGRPLYDFGMLDRAERHLDATLELLRPKIRAAVPIVVLEPSCLSVFRDELHGLRPTDEDARRLGKQALLLSEFLAQEGVPLPKLERHLTTHGHCHHKSVLGFDAEREVLQKLGADVQVLDSGCCGMAGSFGFEPEKVDISLQIGERRLLPAVRHAAADDIVVADGFSCREQIAQTTKRRAVHLAELLAMAQRHGPKGPAGELPERGFVEPIHLPRSAVRRGLPILGVALLGAAVVRAAPRLRADRA